MVNSSRPLDTFGPLGRRVVDLGSTSLTTRHDERATLEARRSPPTTSTIDPADTDPQYLSDWLEGLPERLDPTQYYRELGPAGNAMGVIQGEAVYVWDDVDGRYCLGARLSRTPPPDGYQCNRVSLDELEALERGQDLSRPCDAVDRAELLDQLYSGAEPGFMNLEVGGYRRSARVDVRAEPLDKYAAGFERLKPFPMCSLFGAGSLGAILGMGYAGDGVFGRASNRLVRGAFDMNPWPATHGPVSEESDRVATSKAEAKRARRAERNKKLVGGGA